MGASLNKFILGPIWAILNNYILGPMGAGLNKYILGPIISRNLRQPDGLAGRLVLKRLTRHNQMVVENAVKLCQIQPNHRVLEVGYGHGVGLQAAYQLIKDGQGSIHGIDISETAYKMTLDSMQDLISEGKVYVDLCGITEMSFEPNYFDRIFHSNCFYFWDDMDPEVIALHRVLKPDGLMVATLNPASLQAVNQKGFMNHGNTDPARYMSSLEKHGFKNVYMSSLEDKRTGLPFNAIYATAAKLKS